MSFTGAANDNTSGIDIAFNELGFDHEAIENLRVLGFSANTGNEPEVVLATAGYPQTAAVTGRVYVAVKSATGSYSAADPYALQIETSRPFDVLALEPADQAPVVSNPSTETSEINTQESPLTLFVTQLERLSSLYPAGSTPGDGRDGGQIVRDALLAVADRADVRGKIISLPANLYTNWDVRPWLVDEANELAQALRSEIQAHLAPSIQYVVVVGNDRIVPFRRVIDQTIIGNEQNYTDESFLTPPSATLSSIANGYFMTDDFYVDETPISWNGSYLYVPDVAISRLVETPAEIAGTIQAFIDVDGELAPAAAVVSGHSFMRDGAQVVRDILEGGGIASLDVPGSLLTETWRGADLWVYLNSGPEVTSLNSHFTHYAGLSAYGYGQSEAGDEYGEGELFLSGDVAAAVAADGETPLFKGKLTFSMGCHAGLNAPDTQAVDLTGSPVVPALDLPQAMMRQGAVYVGSTGYGYGDTVGIAGTEALIGFFAEKLVGGTGSVGLALAQAKQDYLGSLSTLTPYEQKSSVQFTLYGMPQYRLPATATASGAASTSSGSFSAASVSGSGAAVLDPFRLKLGERSMQTTWTSSLIDQSYEMLLHTGSTGQYITADGRAEATPDRPIHPVVATSLPTRSDQGPAHGFVYKQGSYAALPGTFEPAISRFTTEWEVGEAEFQVATSEFWPVQPGVLTTIETAGGYDQAFVTVPAQFKPTGTDEEGNIEGTERVWSYLEAEVLRSLAPAGGPEDWLPPSVADVDLYTAGGNVTVSVDAHDSSGISRIVVLQMGANGMHTPAGGDHYFGNPGTPNGAEGRYEVTITLAGADPATVSLLIQVVDGRGNVTTLTGKGATLRLQSGLRNPGFEEGLKYWDIAQPVAGNAVVIEGQDTAPILGTLGIDVRPLTENKMLRLGVPKDKDAHQVKGVTSASQQFIADGVDIVAAYRIITVDKRANEDIFVVDVKDVSGNPAGQIQGQSPPYKVGIVLDRDQAYKDTGWVTIRISGLSKGQTYTLSYALNNTKSASHDTWVYVDRGN